MLKPFFFSTARFSPESSYFDRHYSELGSNPSAYGHYQFSMVLSALDDQIDIAQALQ